MTGELKQRQAAAQAWYQQRRGDYEDLRRRMHDLITQSLADRGVQVHAVDSRLKTEASYVDKCVRPRADGALKYDDPRNQVTDLAAFRITTYLATEVPQVLATLSEIFGPVVPEPHAYQDLSTPGYASLHVTTRLPEARLAFPEYRRFSGMPFEIQVRTILQHAWAEIQHDVVYKGTEEVPDDLRRRLISLAGLLELADREFADVLTRLAGRREAEESVAGDASDAGTELLSTAVLRYELDRKFGGAGDLHPDWFKPFLAVLRELGILTRAALDESLSRSSVDTGVVRATLVDHGYHPGPIEVADALLRISMGQAYLDARSAYRAADPPLKESAGVALRGLRMAVGAS